MRTDLIVKPILRAILIAVIFGGLIWIGPIPFSFAQNSTPVSGIISSNTTWTKANSPYKLTGPTAVSLGVTLTIEAGTTVNILNYYVQVNGTLSAKGTSTNQIQFNGGQIIFTSVSNGWNEQTDSGSIIENAILNDTSINIKGSNPRINNNIATSIDVGNGSSTISNNTITVQLLVAGGSPTISNNIIGVSSITGVYIAGGSPTILHNTINGGVEERGVNVGSPVISFNTITGGIDVDSRGGPITISNNSITGNGFQVIKMIGILSTIVNNTLTGVGDTTGIYMSGVKSLISGNVISGCTTAISSGFAIIEKNTIYGNSGTGIDIGQGNETINGNIIFNNEGSGISVSSGATVTIQNNTIANNTVGISISSPSIVFAYNNIQNNRQNSLYLSGVTANMDVANNWWGTTDIAKINQTIHDYKNDFNLGNVTFIPFLTSPNPEAPAIPIFAPSPTPMLSQSPSPSLTPTSSIPEFPTWIVLSFVAVISVVVILFKKGIKRH